MVNFGLVFLLATSISALPAVRRDTAETLANLQSIDVATDELTTTVSGWDGSLLGALGINGAAQSLGVSRTLRVSW